MLAQYLRDAAEGIAAALPELRPGELIAVMLEKGWGQVAAVLGILRKGGAYLPVDPKQPAHRVEKILRRAVVKAAIIGDTEVELPKDLPRIRLGDAPSQPLVHQDGKCERRASSICEI